MYLVLQIFGHALKLRQQVISTAMVFYRRFYSRNSVQICDPSLLVATSIYLAAKVEECGTVSAKNVAHAAQVSCKYLQILIESKSSLYIHIVYVRPFFQRDRFWFCEGV